MSSLRNIIVWSGRTLALVLGLLTLAGCVTTEGDGPAAASTNSVSSAASAIDYFTIRVGEQLTVEFRDITPEQKLEKIVEDDGTISLPLDVKVKAVGKGASELAQEIHDQYVPKFYRRLSVNIKREGRYYTVGGQVKAPGILKYTGDMTVIKAIQSAGDFTVYANQKKVQIIRTDGKKETVNVPKALKNPKLDLPIYPGDRIHVPESIY